jgi:ATP-dependent Clp protease protease subunit
MDVILNSKTPIITYCLGKCFSMGFALFICGHIRIIGERSYCMYHQMSYSIENCLETIESSMGLSKKLQEKIHNIIIKKTKIKLNQLEKCNKNKEDWFMDKDECIKLGIADYVYEG